MTTDLKQSSKSKKHGSGKGDETSMDVTPGKSKKHSSEKGDVSRDDTPSSKSKKRAADSDDDDDGNDEPSAKVAKNGATANAKAYPLSNDRLSQDLLDLVDIACKHKLVKKGANETTKAVNRGRADFIVIAADTTPLEIVLHLPLLCEDKNIPYVFLPSRTALGRACGLSRPVIACAVLTSENTTIRPQSEAIRKRIEQLII